MKYAMILLAILAAPALADVSDEVFQQTLDALTELQADNDTLTQDNAQLAAENAELQGRLRQL